MLASPLPPPRCCSRHKRPHGCNSHAVAVAVAARVCVRGVPQTFIDVYDKAGWTLTKTSDGYYTRQRKGQTLSAAQCVHGGTTGTVIVIVDCRWVFVANVGDSTGLLLGFDDASFMKHISQWGGGGASPVVSASASASSSATPSAAPSAGSSAGAGAGAGASTGAGGVPASIATDMAALIRLELAERACSDSKASLAPSARFLELSADHSPESVLEFTRMAQFRPCPHRKFHPELLFVYDALSSSKLSCPLIFNVSDTGVVSKTGRGSYYKNVRNEWATLVCTPAYSPFQDALAFTRSLGDFHLQAYGVSYVRDEVALPRLSFPCFSRCSPVFPHLW